MRIGAEFKISHEIEKESQLNIGIKIIAVMTLKTLNNNKKRVETKQWVDVNEVH